MHTLKIAILVDTATGWGRRLVHGILDYARQHGPWDIWIEPRGQDEEMCLPPGMIFDGVIARVSTPAMARTLMERELPVVNISALDVEGADFPRVTTDWNASARLAETHFRDRGLEHFAYLGPLHLAYVREHEQAFEATLSRSGAPCHIFPSPGQVAAGNGWTPSPERLSSWLRGLPKPVGVLTWACQVGRDVIHACHEAELSVPHDVAVLGGDFDELLSDASHPALSGIVVPAGRIGYQAAELLDQIRGGGAIPRNTVLVRPEEVEARLSTETLAIDDAAMVKVLTWLRAHACEPIQVADLLRQAPMSRRVLERKFKQVLGRGPAQEIRSLRMNHARELLAKTDLSMQEIAESCGYATYTYLGNLFKQETGISPGRYRRQMRPNRIR